MGALPEEHFRLQAVLLLQEPPGRLRNVPPGCSGQRRGGLLAVLGLGQDLWGGGAPFLHAGHAPPSPEPAGLRRELCSPERTAGSRRPASGVQRQSKPEIWAREDVRKLISSLVEGLAGFKIGPDSPFLESGLDSLSILSLSSQLSAALKRQVPAALISENPTIEQLSGALAMEARPALYLPLSSSTRLDFDVQISEESRRPHPSMRNGCVSLVVNDISQHEAVFSFDSKLPAASTSEVAPSNFEAPGWEEFSSFDIPKDARNRVWTAILTRVSDGIQVTLLSL